MKKGTDSLMKFQLLKKDLNLPLYAAVGLLQLMWDFTARNTPAGNIGKFTDEELAMGLEYDGDPGELIEALVNRNWLDRDDRHRLIVHDWAEHCEDSVHNALVKSRAFFADGSIPKLTRIHTKDRAEIERDYKKMMDNPGGDPPSDSGPGNPQDTPPDSPENPPENSRARNRAFPRGNAPTDTDTDTDTLPIPIPSRTEPGPRDKPKPRPNPEPGGRSDSVGRSDSAISSVSDLSESVLSKHHGTELWRRLRKAADDPEHYRAWWKEVGGLMKAHDGVGVLFEAVEYVEQCKDPQAREVKGLGTLNKPGAYIANKCKKHLESRGVRLPAKPKEVH